MGLHTSIETNIKLSEYNYAWPLSRSRWAWEFLRRNPEFQNVASVYAGKNISDRMVCNGIVVFRAAGDQSVAEEWGLSFLPDIQQNGFDAMVFWSGTQYPRTVTVQVTPRAVHEIDEIFAQSLRYGRIIHLTDTAGREHLLVKGNGRVVQVGCSGLSLLSLEPVRVKLTIDTISNFDEAIAVINRTKGLFAEDFSKDDPEWTRETTAFRNALIALDCHAAGLTHFDTACVIYGQQAAEEAWSDTGRAMKDEMKRALTRGRELRDGGYRQLLKPERV